MKYIIALDNKENLDILDHELHQVVIGNRELSRNSKLSLSESIELIEMSHARNFEVFFDFDILATQEDFNSILEFFKELPLDKITAIRAQDLGVAYYVLNHSDCDLHLITETGNHNLEGLKAYEEYFGERLKRLVLSHELNWEVLKSYKKVLSTPLEILGFGRILIFYTPRKLVSHYDRFEWINDQIEVSASSEESPHKGFPVIENKHGTFMYHLKDLFLFDRRELILESDVDFVRIDVRHLKDINLARFLEEIESVDGKSLKAQYAPQSIRGYFITNKSDVLFKKLKNHRTQRKDDNYLGEVIDSLKGQYMAINLKGGLDLNIGDEVEIFNPDGKTKILQFKNLKDSSGKNIDKGSGGLVLTEYIGGIWVKAQIYKKSAQDDIHPTH